MDGDGTTTEEISEGEYSDLPESVRPPRRYPKWPFVLAGFFLLIGITIALAWPIKVPYYTLSPGPIYDTSDFVAVEDGNTDADGELFFLTVSLKEANIFEYLAAKITPAVDLAERRAIRPAGVSSEDLKRENLAHMDQSKIDAAFVALTTLGYEPTYTGTGALVIETVPGSAAEGELRGDDVIVAIDGTAVEFRSDVIDLLADRELGDTVVVDVERSAAGDDPEIVEITIVLGPHTDDPTKPMIGILLDNNDPIIEFPVEVDIDSQNIGGPSAGQMFALQIINQLTDDDITHGRRIAGTGTIGRDGTVGPIGGVRQKVHAAIDAGATVILVPAGNYDDAIDAAGNEIVVVKVVTIDDSLDYLASLSDPEGPQ
jgi:PDZ domain-containing protein